MLHADESQTRPTGINVFLSQLHLLLQQNGLNDRVTFSDGGTDSVEA